MCSVGDLGMKDVVESHKDKEGASLAGKVDYVCTDPIYNVRVGQEDPIGTILSSRRRISRT